MHPNAFDPEFADLPTTLPIFPLAGAALVPGQELPLNIFEPRYLDMVFDALKSDRTIGMIQPRPDAADQARPAVFAVGCAGRITAFNETDDGRLLITLRGVCRYRVREELESIRGYRRIQPDWSPYRADVEAPPECAASLGEVRDVLESYLARHSLQVSWDKLQKLPVATVVDFLAVNVPFSPQEKQALVEAATATERVALMETIVRLDPPGAEAADAARH